MNSHDYFEAPIFILLVTIVAFAFRENIQDRYLYKYYGWALYSKFIGALALGAIYSFYYGGGDTISYHIVGHQIALIADFDFDSFFHIITHSIAEQDADVQRYTRHNIFVQKRDERTYFLIRIVAVVEWLTVETYSIKALVFSCFSFIGTALMYKTFADIYPRMRKKLFLICFFIPSVVFWGSGLMKDSLTFAALGISFYGFYFGIIKRRQLLFAIPAILIGFWLIYKIKLYILICWIPALVLWAYLVYNASIKSWFLRIIIAPILLAGAGFIGFTGVTQITQDTEYSFLNIAEKTSVTSKYLRSISTEGGSYDIGEYDGTLTGLLKYIPQAVVVALFRPFPWEAGFNPVRLLSALEAFGFLLLTLWVLTRTNPFRILRTIIAEPPVAASLAFALAFAFAVGVASGNFGALVRYKIPMMPFYLVAMLVLLDKSKKEQSSKSKKKTKHTKRKVRNRKIGIALSRLSIPKSGFNHLD